MFTAIFGPNPGANLVLTAAAMLALIVMIVHILRRKFAVAKAADDTEAKVIKGRMRLSLYITLFVLVLVFAAASWTGQMQMEDMYHIVGIGLGAIVIGIVIAVLVNTIIAPGSIFVRVLMAPVVVVFGMLMVVATVNIHNVYMASHQTYPLWSWGAYNKVLPAADYTAGFYLFGLLPSVLVIWGIVAGVRWFRNRNATP
jgi:hypothetical protein